MKNMKKIYFKKEFTLVIIFLFIGTSITPIVYGNKIEQRPDECQARGAINLALFQKADTL